MISGKIALIFGKFKPIFGKIRVNYGKFGVIFGKIGTIFGKIGVNLRTNGAFVGTKTIFAKGEKGPVAVRKYSRSVIIPPMPRQYSPRNVLKWSVTIITITLALAFVVSGFLPFKLLAGSIEVQHGGLVLEFENKTTLLPLVSVEKAEEVVWGLGLPSMFADGGGTVIMLPLWIPLVLAGMPTRIMWVRERDLKIYGPTGKCVKCGYNRRGIPIRAKCPECGLVPSAPNA